MSVMVTFEAWMADYAPNEYIPSTIKNYVRSLSKAPEVLGVSLQKPVLECFSTIEFDAAYEALVSVDNYTAKNKNYGHGSISAALGAYKKYLLFLEKMTSKGSGATIYSSQWFYEVAQTDDLRQLDEKAQMLRDSFECQFSVDVISALTTPLECFKFERNSSGVNPYARKRENLENPTKS